MSSLRRKDNNHSQLEQHSPPEINLEYHNNTRYKKRSDHRDLRLSSNKKDNSVYELERRIRENKCAHHNFQPTLQNDTSLKYIKYLSNTRNQDKEEADAFIKSIDPNNPLIRQSSKLKFDFASIRDKQFRLNNLKYKNLNLIKSFENNMQDDDYLLSKEKEQKRSLVYKKDQTLQEQQLQLLSRVNKVVDKFIKDKFINKKSSHDFEMNRFRASLMVGNESQLSYQSTNSKTKKRANQLNLINAEQLNASFPNQSPLHERNKSSMTNLQNDVSQSNMSSMFPSISRNTLLNQNITRFRYSNMNSSFDVGGAFTVVQNQPTSQLKNPRTKIYKQRLNTIIQQIDQQPDYKKDHKNLESLVEENENIYDAVVKYNEMKQVANPNSNLTVNELMGDAKEWESNIKEIICTGIKKYLQDFIESKT